MTKTVVMTWLWKQPGSRVEYTAGTVNGWAHATRKNTTLDIEIACVTDCPEGIEDWIRIIKPPGYFETVSSPTWPAANGWPQCYRRLALFHPDAKEIFGGDRLVSMDMDMLVTGNLDKILGRQEDFLMFKGTSGKRPYNGSLMMLDAGARPQVFTEFTPEKALESGKKFIGSDQAWISHCLGWGETTLSEKDGVVAYTTHFINKNGGTKAYKHPDHVSMMFFPGVVKAFNGIKQVYGAARKDDRVISVIAGVTSSPKVEPKKDAPTLYAYDDPKHWGKWFQEACKRQGVQCVLFKKSSQVPDGSRAFVRVDQQSTQREISKGIVEQLAAKKCITLPTSYEGLLYDDKGMQSEEFEKWMPETAYIRDKAHAIQMAEHIEDVTKAANGKKTFWKWPIYSKAIDGAGSKCVRKINSLAEALAEIEQAWGAGIPSAYTRVQRNYVLWQEYIPSNACTLRITVVGDYIVGHERQHDDDGLPIPGENKPMTFQEPHQIAVAQKAIEIIEAIGTKWMCFDFLQSDQGDMLMLECSSAWPTKSWFADAPMYTKDLKPTKHKGKDMFDIAVDVLLNA
jgi:glutathione synthase/RimK-type ligase-like ATP-grasp enzyme